MAPLLRSESPTISPGKWKERRRSSARSSEKISLRTCRLELTFVVHLCPPPLSMHFKKTNDKGGGQRRTTKAENRPQLKAAFDEVRTFCVSSFERKLFAVGEDDASLVRV